MNTDQFTKEIKTKWIEALKSGKYIQGYVALTRIEDKGPFGKNPPVCTHCCIGVLGEIHPSLSATPKNTDRLDNPYEFLQVAFKDEKMDEQLWTLNDKDQVNKSYKGEYKNVLPFIEQMKTVD
jgi:hypothetical protein